MLESGALSLANSSVEQRTARDDQQLHADTDMPFGIFRCRRARSFNCRLQKRPACVPTPGFARTGTNRPNAVYQPENRNGPQSKSWSRERFLRPFFPQSCASCGSACALGLNTPAQLS